MKAGQLKEGRKAAGLTQVQAAVRLGVSQPYLSQLERGRRAVPARLAAAAARLYRLPPTAAPLPDRLARVPSAATLPRLLAALGYPGYAHLPKRGLVNPAGVVLDALVQRDLDGRVAEALPWVLLRYPDLDWAWLASQAKSKNVQNRLGFLVALTRELAENGPHNAAARKLTEAERELEPARLAAETTLGRESMPPAEKAWLRRHRSHSARHWNVLSGLRARSLPYAA
jgi:transcriptional regulator with XRE-family HTH domain